MLIEQTRNLTSTLSETLRSIEIIFHRYRSQMITSVKNFIWFKK